MKRALIFRDLWKHTQRCGHGIGLIVAVWLICGQTGWAQPGNNSPNKLNTLSGKSAFDRLKDKGKAGPITTPPRKPSTLPPSRDRLPQAQRAASRSMSGYQGNIKPNRAQQRANLGQEKERLMIMHRSKVEGRPTPISKSAKTPRNNPTKLAKGGAKGGIAQYRGNVRPHQYAIRRQGPQLLVNTKNPNVGMRQLQQASTWKGDIVRKRENPGARARYIHTGSTLRNPKKTGTASRTVLNSGPRDVSKNRKAALPYHLKAKNKKSKKLRYDTKEGQIWQHQRKE